MTKKTQLITLINYIYIFYGVSFWVLQTTYQIKYTLYKVEKINKKSNFFLPLCLKSFITLRLINLGNDNSIYIKPLSNKTKLVTDCVTYRYKQKLKC